MSQNSEYAGKAPLILATRNGNSTTSYMKDIHVWVVFVAAAVATNGCASHPLTYSADYKAKFEKKVGADEQKARAFVADLARVPPSGRVDYVRSHSADARNLARIPDQDLQKQYKDIVLNRK